jgi:hypothetical protein
MPQVPKIGAYVLETLTTGMYTNPLDAIREFVQNAADSIRRAEEDQTLRRGEGRIDIKVDNKSKTMVIRDNGSGLLNTEVSSQLINIGMSNKHIGTDAGFRGIGRLAGIAYCRNLIFRTTSYGDETVTTLDMDCEGLKRSIAPSMRQVEELVNVIAQHSRIKNEQWKKDDHFFEVVLEGIDPSQTPDFLDWRALEKYLCQVAPVKMDTQHFIFAPKIAEWLRQNELNVPDATLVLKTPEIEREVFKPYKTHYKTQKDNYVIKIMDVCFYPEKTTLDIPFWLWFGKTDLLGTIDDERVAGLRFRKHNISIGGPERVADIFTTISASYYRFNAWYIGEIHILAKDVIPNARRDGFEKNDAWAEIIRGLLPFIRDRCAETYSTSQARNIPIAKVVRSSQKIIENANKKLKIGFVSPEERNDMLEQIGKEEEKVTKVIEARKDKSPNDIETITPIVEELGRIKKALEEEDHFAVKKIRSDLDRKQRKLLTEILQILYETLEEEQFNKAKTAILTRYQIDELSKK